MSEQPQPRGSDEPERVRPLPSVPGVDLDAIERAVRAILVAIGEDPDRDGLRQTPERVAKMYAEILSAVGDDAADQLDVLFAAGHDEMIMERNIPFASVCEHHLIPFIGKAHVAYIPNLEGQITGLSKIARLVDAVSRKPQVQERLTVEIADALEKALSPRGVLVVIEAEHLCMTMRGVRKPGAQTVTSAVRGVFRDNDATRAEAMGLIARG
ncbi:MAG: GTP cyclohydrolase I FolE [Actinomycetota bacterium]